MDGEDASNHKGKENKRPNSPEMNPKDEINASAMNHNETNEEKMKEGGHSLPLLPGTPDRTQSIPNPTAGNEVPFASQHCSYLLRTRHLARDPQSPEFCFCHRFCSIFIITFYTMRQNKGQTMIEGNKACFPLNP
ncbi:hypothetical protein HNY73_021763 [Argiope bruennichi]|uniref:Uncharacterized protein n=1 Tax=Argiope bruennichi TaxID=94029 RepID=A0A8T0DYL0_ARGBR|nr:hypothetical protein HNY73_021763 [Argiope bruennichi]